MPLVCSVVAGCMTFPFWYPQVGDIVFNHRWHEFWLVLSVEETQHGDAVFFGHCFSTNTQENWTWRGCNITMQDLECDWTLIRNGAKIFGKKPLHSSISLL